MAYGDPMYDRDGNIVGYEGMEAEEVGITDEMGNIMIPGPETLDPDSIDTSDILDEDALRAEALEVSQFLAQQLKEESSRKRGQAKAKKRLQDKMAKEAASKAEVQRINKERQADVAKMSRGQAMRKEMLDRRGKGGRRGRMFRRLSAFRIPDGSGLPGQGGQGTMFN
tara:strand:+ start:1142 stop:1645 length:504 start_codon:yes stop_codon:yes gene_type:complete